MTKRYHLPDWVIAGLADGTVDVIDYTVPNVATVVMTDGSRHDISIEITAEILEREYEKMAAEARARGGFAAGRFHLRVNMRRMVGERRGLVSGWTK